MTLFRYIKRPNLLLLVAIIVFSPLRVNVADAIVFDPGGLYNSYLKLGTLPPDLVAVKIVQTLLAFVGLLALLMILWGGFMWLFSAGSSERLRKARDILFAAIVGLAIIMAAYGIVNYVFNKFNVDINPPPAFIERIRRV